MEFSIKEILKVTWHLTGGSPTGTSGMSTEVGTKILYMEHGYSCTCNLYMTPQSIYAMNIMAMIIYFIMNYESGRLVDKIVAGCVVTFLQP